MINGQMKAKPICVTLDEEVLDGVDRVSEGGNRSKTINRMLRISLGFEPVGSDPNIVGVGVIGGPPKDMISAEGGVREKVDILRGVPGVRVASEVSRAVERHAVVSSVRGGSVHDDLIEEGDTVGDVVRKLRERNNPKSRGGGEEFYDDYSDPDPDAMALCCPEVAPFDSYDCPEEIALMGEDAFTELVAARDRKCMVKGPAGVVVNHSEKLVVLYVDGGTGRHHQNVVAVCEKCMRTIERVRAGGGEPMATWGVLGELGK